MMAAGEGGTPPVPAGYIPPSLPGLAAGAFAGIFRGRQVLISGSGSGAGLFVYNGTPGAGNAPVFCVVSPTTTTDPYGNGITGIVEIGQQSGGHWHWDASGNLDVNNTASALIARWRPTDQALLFYNPGGGLGNLLMGLAAAAGTDQDGNAFPKGMLSQQLTLVNQASAPPAFTGASVFYSSTAGRPRYLSSAGVDAVLDRSVVNTSQFTVGNVITPTIISSPLSYLGGEGSQSSEYELEFDGIITTATSGTTQTLTFGLGVDGTIIGAQFTLGAVFLPLSVTLSYTVRLRLTIVTTGAGGTCNVAADGQVSRQGVNAGSSTTPVPTVAVGALGTGKAFDTTSAHTLQGYANWGGSTAGQALTTYRTRISRRD